MTWHGTGPKEAGPFHESDLKICELCGALNLAANRACFVCGWHGRFEKKPEVIKLAMECLKRQHGQLDLRLLTDPSVHLEAPDRSLRARLARLLLRARIWFFG